MTENFIKVVKEKDAIYGFKGFVKGYTCRGHSFDLKETNSIKNKKAIRLCNNGFHACESLIDIDGHYPTYEANHVFALVKQWGTVHKTNDKQASTHIKIIKKLSKKKIESLKELEIRLKDNDIAKDIRCDIVLKVAQDLC